MSATHVDQRKARSLLGSLIALGLAFLLLQGVAMFKAGGWQAFAQTPTPTPTAPHIELLNPTQTDPDMSAKQDQDTKYHLNAWVQNVPASPSVLFKLMDGTDELAQISGVQVASSPDTFEAFWDIPGSIDDGSYTLLAELYSSGSEVDEDSEAVALNNQDADNPLLNPDPDDQGETAEIIYPTNGGPLGVYTNPETNAKNFVMLLKFSAATANMRPVYSTSTPGTEPTWTPCQSSGGGYLGDAEVYRCALPANVSATAVTAVGVVADDTPFPFTPPGNELQDFTDSGDAHRALSYPAVPTDIVLPNPQRDTDANKCAFFEAKVMDQVNHTIADVNLDVHALGPDDDLKFGTAGAGQDASKAPDKGHGSTEPGETCVADGTGSSASATQGEHDRLSEDVKHVESTNNTKNDGTYKFSLFSGVTGTTQFTVWADKDADDLRCPDEVFENGSIGWKPTPPPSIAGVAADLATCPVPTPTGSATPTKSPTPTPSKSSPTPTASRSTTPAQQSRVVTLVADKDKVAAGKTVRFSGSVVSSTQSCTDAEFVQLKRRIHGETTVVDVGSANTDSSGAFHFDLIVQKNADYTATAPAHDNCATATSDPVTVLVKVKVFVAVEKNKVHKGDTVRIKAAVRPQHDGTKVKLEYKKGNKWVKFKTAKLNKKSIGKFKFTAKWKGKRVFRVRWPAQDDDHEAGKSKSITVTSKA